jgi:hypothetical protein
MDFLRNPPINFIYAACERTDGHNFLIIHSFYVFCGENEYKNLTKHVVSTGVETRDTQVESFKARGIGFCVDSFSFNCLLYSISYTASGWRMITGALKKGRPVAKGDLILRAGEQKFTATI